MKKYLSLPFAIGAFLVFGFSAVSAQDADAFSAEPSRKVELPSAQTVIAKYVEAIGGREAGMRIKSRSFSGKVQIVQAGVSGAITGYQMPDAYSLVKMDVAGLGEFSEGFDGTTGWGNDPIQGFRVKSGEELARAKLSSAFYRDLELAKLYSKLEVTGITAVDGNDAYVVRATTSGKDPDIMYFDIKTGLLVRHDMVIVSPAGSTPSINLFSEYRDIDGIKYPYRTLTKTAQFDLVMELEDVKHNVEIDKKIFAPPSKPKTDAKPKSGN